MKGSISSEIESHASSNLFLLILLLLLWRWWRDLEVLDISLAQSVAYAQAYFWLGVRVSCSGLLPGRGGVGEAPEYVSLTPSMT
jgi:hypothetical protein